MKENIRVFKELSPWFTSVQWLYPALFPGCVRDVRYNREWFPMDASENSESSAADVVDSQGLDDDCETNACEGVVCPEGFVCEDYWRIGVCV